VISEVQQALLEEKALIGEKALNAKHHEDLLNDIFGPHGQTLYSSYLPQFLPLVLSLVYSLVSLPGLNTCLNYLVVLFD